MEVFDKASLIEDQQHKLAKNFLALSVFRNGIGADSKYIYVCVIIPYICLE
jgi:hypothetical protein